MTAVPQLELAWRPARPFLKWVGGKRQLCAPLMAEFLSYSWTRYHEPFVGGGAMFWEVRNGLPNRPAFINDACVRLARTYRAVRDDHVGVAARLLEHQHAYRAAAIPTDYYYAQRAREIDEQNNVEVAAWMIFLNKTGFNGLYRVNAAGRFNNPHGRRSNRQQEFVICDGPNLQACSEALRGLSIMHMDFQEACEEANPGDLVYLDPPYVPVAADSFTSYTAGGFGPTSQIRLRDTAAEMRDRGIHVVLSNSGAPWVRELYQGWKIQEVKARRNINSKGTGRGPVQEVIISS